MWLGIVGAALVVLKWAASWWSAEARLHRLELYYERLRSRQAVERERLEATYKRIEREAPKAPERVADELTERLRRIRDQAKRDR